MPTRCRLGERRLRHRRSVVRCVARRIVGWRASASFKTDLVLDAVEQAICDRHTERADGLVHHSDHGVLYLAIRHTVPLGEAGVESSVGSVGDSYANGIAESVIGLFKTEVIRNKGPWRNLVKADVMS